MGNSAHLRPSAENPQEKLYVTGEKMASFEENFGVQTFLQIVKYPKNDNKIVGIARNIRKKNWQHLKLLWQQKTMEIHPCQESWAGKRDWRHIRHQEKAVFHINNIEICFQKFINHSIHRQIICKDNSVLDWLILLFKM